MNIFIFRRDFRLKDNNGLIKCLKDNKNVLCIFIFTPEQIDKNKYKSSNSIQFMIESLKDLDNNLKKYNSKLHIFYGKNIDVLKKINEIDKINKIYCNKDYTNYAKKRDNKINNLFNLELVEDYLLHKMDTLLKNNNEPYKVFTPFFNNSKKFNVEKPTKFKLNKSMFLNKNYNFLINFDFINNFYNYNKDLYINGGRNNAIKRLKFINLNNYNKTRNELNIESSLLSAYIKYGCLSIREIYHTLKNKYDINNKIFSQLYWREFYYYIINYFPNVLDNNFNDKYKIKWENNMQKFSAWKNGKTGFPIVDANMNMLNKTGYMHNRGRLIVSSFLVKLLNIDWKYGEKYFATKLIDYDPAVNNGNWQWIAGTGVDYQQMYRILNPHLQTEKFDKDCLFIKKWIKEFENIDKKIILNWNNEYKNYNIYYKPIIDYQESRKIFLDNLKIKKLI